MMRKSKGRGQDTLASLGMRAGYVRGMRADGGRAYEGARGWGQPRRELPAQKTIKHFPLIRLTKVRGFCYNIVMNEASGFPRDARGKIPFCCSR